MLNLRLGSLCLTEIPGYLVFRKILMNKGSMDA